MIQRCFARATRSRSLCFPPDWTSSIYVGSASPRGHSIKSHSCSRGWWSLWSRCAARMRTAAKRERKGWRVPSRHVTVFHALAGKFSASCLADTGACSASRRRRLAGRPRPEYFGAEQRFDSRRPDGGGALDAQHIAQFQPGHRLTKARVVAVSRVSQHRSLGNSVGHGLADLAERDLQLGLEQNLLGNPGLLPVLGVVGPGLGQIQAVGDGQTSVPRGHRQADGHLAVILLAGLAAILSRYADRMSSLFRKPGVVDDPGHNWVASRSSPPAHSRVYSPTGPRRST